VPALSTTALQHGKFAPMPVRPFPALFVAAALLSGTAHAVEDSLPLTTQPAPPLGILPAEEPKQPANRPRLSPSQLYAQQHGRRQQPPPRFATVRPTPRKPAPGDTAETPRTAGDVAKPAPQAPAARPAAATPPVAAPQPAGCNCGAAAAKPASKPRRNSTVATNANRPTAAGTANATTTTTSSTATQTASTLPPPAPTAPMPEIIVRPQVTAAAIYEAAARQYRELRVRDLDRVRDLLSATEYRAKLALIDAAYRPGDGMGQSASP
jgi:hypothetical protein